MGKKTAIIIGAGPAGLTAAYELLTKTDIKPIIFEMSGDIGGISKTINYKGNRIDIGGHRFFSKSDRVMDWWTNILPPEDVSIQDGPDPEKNDRIMLIRNRLSRIFFLRKFFDYPVSLNFNTFKNLGMSRIVKVGFSYLKARLFPLKQEKTLEEFFINRFGNQLYLTFFKDYTEKVWGISCDKIAADWGAQRIKGLSITSAVLHAVKNFVSSESSISQKNTETSLIEKFMYPKYGPGQMWEEVAEIVKEKGGEIFIKHKAVEFDGLHDRILTVNIRDENTGNVKTVKGDYFFSTMPIKELMASFINEIPADVDEVAQGLMYRDFITVGLLLKKLKVGNESEPENNNNIIPDNWVYIQEKDVKLGRLQIFNNWSPYMVKDPDTVWIGLEYFCNEDDELYTMPEDEFAEFAIDELARIDIIEKEDVLDNIVIKMPKTYPAYFGTYDRFDTIRNYTDKIDNLFLVGRNGQHRYNNADHSMLTAMLAVENIQNNVITKDNLWEVNTEEEYHESR
jgi:protoporphyrinogen oxidase